MRTVLTCTSCPPWCTHHDPQISGDAFVSHRDWESLLLVPGPDGDTRDIWLQLWRFDTGGVPGPVTVVTSELHPDEPLTAAAASQLGHALIEAADRATPVLRRSGPPVPPVDKINGLVWCEGLPRVRRLRAPVRA